MINAETFFTAEEKKQVSSVIAEVELKTAGEVAVMVVDKSDTYPESRLLAGILIGGSLSLLVTDQFFSDSLWIFAPMMAVLSILLGWLINFMPDIKKFFTPVGRLEERVRNRALQAFFEKELYKTRDDTGVLFFISLFEHKVWILADKGIYEKIAPEELLAYAVDVAHGVKTGKTAEALCRAIKKVGAILARHFPVKSDDSKELSNEVITG